MCVLNSLRLRAPNIPPAVRWNFVVFLLFGLSTFTTTTTTTTLVVCFFSSLVPGLHTHTKDRTTKSTAHEKKKLISFLVSLFLLLLLVPGND